MVFRGYLYCLSSEYTNRYGIKKLGYSSDPVSRLRTYNTGDPPEIMLDKVYDMLWLTNATNDDELMRYEQILHDNFSECRLKRGDNYTEWFKIDLMSIRQFLYTQQFVVSEVSYDDVEPIDKQQQLSKQYSLKDDFFRTFLSGYEPRPIQRDLWNIWEHICMNNNTYRGIVQWATGTGKTIGLLIILYQLAHKLKNEGKIFRGLLIAPTNDIFDTIMVHINKMNAYGIKVVEGHNAMLSTIDIPQDIHILVTATHASLTDPEIWDKFPSMNCIHYDEVHRITGSEFYDMLGNYMIKWGTSFLTGTSATPITCVKSQNTRISDLFNPYNIIHRCDMVEAINEGYIAKPCFSLHTINYRSNDDIRRIRDFISIVGQVIMKKRAENWSGGKCIVYLSTIAYVTLAIEICKELLPDFVIYSALENTREKNDMEFVNAEADGTPRLLLSCERYREGADIKGLELTSILIGLTISHNVLLQIMGRSLRKDTPNKEGWCVIVRPSGKRNEDVLLKYLITGTIKYIDRDNSYSNKNYDLKTILYYLFSKVEFNHKLCGSNYIKNIIKDVLINPQKYNPLE